MNQNAKLNESSNLNKSDASFSVRHNLNNNYKKSAYYRLNKDVSLLSVNDRKINNENDNDNVPRLDLRKVTNMRAKLNESMRSDIQKHHKENAKIDKLFQV